MVDLGTTRQSLLARIRDAQDDQAWSEFIDLYSPFVYAFMRRRHLQPADAADVTQDVMRTVFCSLDGFQHSQRHGAFRSWLVTIARSRYCDFLARYDPHVAGSGDSRTIGQLDEQPVSGEEDANDEREYQQFVFRSAAESVRRTVQDSSWQAFWMTYVEGEPCEDAAEGLGMSLEAVYMARSRVLARLRMKVREIEM